MTKWIKIKAFCPACGITHVVEVSDYPMDCRGADIYLCERCLETDKAGMAECFGALNG